MESAGEIPGSFGRCGMRQGIRAMAVKEWKLGDRVVHAGRPEWGIGEIRGAEVTTQDGTKCQRITVRFERAGVKTLTTAFADLQSRRRGRVARRFRQR